MSTPKTIMQILAELKAKDFKDLTHAERATVNANEAIDGLRNEVLSHFGSMEKAAKYLNVEPNTVARTMGQTRTRRMSAWLFAALCRATGFALIETSTEDALKQQPNLTLESFLVIRRVAGELSDAVQIMGRQG